MAKTKKKNRNAQQQSKVLPSAPASNAVNPSLVDKLKLGLILIITFLLYYQTVDFDFVLDDKLVYSENTYVQDGWKGMFKIWTEDSFAGYFQGQRNLVEGARYRPLSLATFAIENALWGGGAKWAHIINVILYLLVLFVLYQVLFLYFPQFNDKRINVADIGTLLFALHPVHTEAVANIKGRDEILALLFVMLTLWMLYLYVRRSKKLFLLTAIGTFLLGILSKEHVLSLAVLAPLAVWFFAGASTKQAFRLFLFFVVVSVIYLVWRYYLVGFSAGEELEFESLMNNPFLEMRPSEKWATILYTLGLYVKLLIFPHPLTHDYYPYHIPIKHWGDAGVLLSGGLYLLLLALAWYGWKRKRVFSYLILFYLGTLFIVSNVPFTIGTFMNERFLFLPSFGFVTALSLIGLKGFYSTKWKWPVALLFVGIALGYAGKTYARIPDWHDGFTLNQAAVKVSKNSARINLFMGVSHYKMAQSSSGEDKASHLEIADHYFAKATRIVPDYFDAWKMRAGVAAERYKMDGNTEHLLNAFQEIILHKPGIPYINDYIKYLKKRSSLRDRLIGFLDKVGYQELYRKKQQYSFALHYMTLGEDIAHDSQYFNHMAEIYEHFAKMLQTESHPKYNPKVLLQHAQVYRKKALSLSSN